MSGKEFTVKASGGLRAHLDPFPLPVRLPAGARLEELISRRS